MLKTYKAGSDLAFNVSTKSGMIRIVFEPQCHGTSIYSTRDVEEQKAMEAHHWFAEKKFWVHSEVDEDKLAAEAKRAASVAKKTEEKKTIVVDDIQEAKDYLAEKFGISRSKMRTTKAILTIAKEHGIELEGLS